MAISTSDIENGTATTVAPDEFWNEVQAARYLGVTPRALQRWRVTGTGPRFLRISSRCIRYRYRDLLAWAEPRFRRSTSANVA